MTTETEIGILPTYEVFKALGHPARLEFVRMLEQKERCVCELVDAVDIGGPRFPDICRF